MSIAEIHGKSSWTTSEDLLTADVFTAFRYLPADAGIIGFLRSIPGVGDVLPAPVRSATAHFYFWPLGATREPDVLLELDIDGDLFHVVVEAKYLSGPSNYDITPDEVEQAEDMIRWGNQLADQLRELQEGVYTVPHRGARTLEKRLQSDPDRRLLLYLTAHAIRPRAELSRSAELCPELAHHLFWSNWYQVHYYLDNHRAFFQDFPFNRVVADLLLLLTGKGFSSFQGVRRPVGLEQIPRSGFWRGRDKPLPSFRGIRQPPEIVVPSQGSILREA